MLTGRARMDDAPDAMSRALQARLAGADPATARAVLAAWGDLRERLYLMRDPTSSGLAAHGHGRKGGPLPGEITRLSYPLRTGARWVIRQDPLFTSVVEGVEPVAVAGHKIPAFRIRIESELAGANDRVHLWASRAGMVKLAYHLEGVAMDENGNVLGLLIAEHRERLLDLHLVAPGRDKDVAANQAE